MVEDRAESKPDHPRPASVGSDPGSGLALVCLTTGILVTGAYLVLSRHRDIYALND